MADPRSFTVKQCSPAYAAKSGAAIASATSQRRDFFNSVGKIGDIAALNDIGGGKIGAGLRTLASVSNSIRAGQGSIPTSIGASVESGANWVLEHTGIGATVVDALRGFHPGIANQAYGQAKAVFQQVQSGTFKLGDIPGYMQDFQNLERLGQNIFTPSSSDGQTTLSERCEASPYAVDLIARSPKYKFLFVVQFLPDAGYSSLGGNDFGPLDMAFTVKKTTRPGVKFVTEDVNYYNFRTKVITKTEFEEMNMTFHDDNMNFATEFYTAYLRAMSPIAGVHPNQSDLLQDHGMTFVGNTLRKNDILKSVDGNVYSASHGPLANDRKQVFKEIRIYHLFDFGNRMTVYRFLNPRITHLAPDDLDMSVGNEGSELALTFSYDSVYVDADVSMKDNAGEYNLAQTQRGAVYPLRNNSSGTNGPSSSGFNPYSSNTVMPATSTAADPLHGMDTGSAVSNLGGGLTLPGFPGSSSFTTNSNSSFSSTTTTTTIITSGAAVAADPVLAAKYSGSSNFNDSGNPAFSDSGNSPRGDL